MVTKLYDLEIDEVSLVDVPANNKRIVFKSMTKGDEMPKNIKKEKMHLFPQGSKPDEDEELEEDGMPKHPIAAAVSEAAGEHREAATAATQAAEVAEQVAEAAEHLAEVAEQAAAELAPEAGNVAPSGEGGEMMPVEAAENPESATVPDIRPEAGSEAPAEGEEAPAEAAPEESEESEESEEEEDEEEEKKKKSVGKSKKGTNKKGSKKPVDKKDDVKKFGPDENAAAAQAAAAARRNATGEGHSEYRDCVAAKLETLGPEAGEMQIKQILAECDHLRKAEGPEGCMERAKRDLLDQGMSMEEAEAQARKQCEHAQATENIDETKCIGKAAPKTEVEKALADRDAKIAQLEKSVFDAKDALVQKEFIEKASKEFAHIPGISSEQFGAVLKHASEKMAPEHYATLLNVFKSVDAMVGQSVLTATIGVKSDAAKNVGSAADRLNAKAAEIMNEVAKSGKSKITFEKAFVLAMQKFPDLYKEYLQGQ